MPATPKPYIPFDSPEAAQIKTVTGWVSRDGRFWGSDENTARYAGCTHLPCKTCGAMIEVRSYCEACSAARRMAAYEAMPRAAWDGKAMLYSDAHDEYFADLSEAYEFLDRLEDGQTLDDLRIVICEPNMAQPLDGSHWCDDLPEDDPSLPAELEAAIDAFNAALADVPPLSWSPGKTALDTSTLEQR